ncbi:MAG: hypothetical protein V1875_07990 [Candidatus Altiarchaeota archaeon]
MDAYTIIFGTALILAAIMVPGFALTAAVMPSAGGIRWSERLGLSLVFGLTPYLLLHFLTKNMNLQITTETTLLTIAAVTIASAAVWKMRTEKATA